MAIIVLVNFPIKFPMIFLWIENGLANSSSTSTIDDQYLLESIAHPEIRRWRFEQEITIEKEYDHTTSIRNNRKL